MNCQKYTDLIPLVAMGEATDAEKAAVEQHAATCADCRAELARVSEVVRLLSPRPGDNPAEIEKLQMENEILRRLTEDTMKANLVRRRGAPLRTLFRLAAAIALIALGYLLRPPVTDYITPSESIAKVSEPVHVSEDLRRAMKSGYRFSGQGLAVIARGADALKDAGDR